MSIFGMEQSILFLRVGHQKANRARIRVCCLFPKQLLIQKIQVTPNLHGLCERNTPQSMQDFLEHTLGGAGAGHRFEAAQSSQPQTHTGLCSGLLGHVLRYVEGCFSVDLCLIPSSNFLLLNKFQSALHSGKWQYHYQIVSLECLGNVFSFPKTLV